jgi:hypothetical protein
MNVAIFISSGNSPQRHREHGGFFWGTQRHAPRWFGRCAALRVAIHPSSSNYHEQTPNLQTRSNADNRSTNLLLPCRSWCSLCLCGEIFFLRDLVARASAGEAVGDGGTTSEAHPLASSCLSGIDYPYLTVSFAANSSDARGGELNDSQRIWLQQKR